MESRYFKAEIDFLNEVCLVAEKEVCCLLQVTAGLSYQTKLNLQCSLLTLINVVGGDFYEKNK